MSEPESRLDLERTLAILRAREAARSESRIAGQVVELRRDDGLVVVVGVDVRAPDQAGGKASRHAPVPLEEPAHVVAEVPVPLGPALADKAAHLVQPGRVPRLGD